MNVNDIPAAFKITRGMTSFRDTPQMTVHQTSLQNSDPATLSLRARLKVGKLTLECHSRGFASSTSPSA